MGRRKGAWSTKAGMRVAAVAICLGISVATPAVCADLQALERPASMSRRAATSTLLAIARAGERFVAVGERGIVLLSDDEGRQWRQAKVPTRVTLTAVHFSSAKKGWAVGHLGVVLTTEDGGESWTKQLDGKVAAQLVLRHFEAMAQRGGEVTKELAAAQLLVEDGPDKPFLDVYFENERDGFIVGAYNLILATRDGGKTWLPWQGQIDNPDGLHLYAIRKIGGQFYIAGERGSLFRSIDGGGRFVRVSSPYDGSFFGLLPTRGGGVVAYGLRGNAFKSVDGGASWKRVETESAASLVAGAVLSDGTLVLANQVGQILVSVDDGTSFRSGRGGTASSLSGLIQAADGTLVVVGAGGVRRIEHRLHNGGAASGLHLTGAGDK